MVACPDLAAGEGFEPSHTESESAVLPLHKPAILYPLSQGQAILYQTGRKSQENFHISCFYFLTPPLHPESNIFSIFS